MTTSIYSEIRPLRLADARAGSLYPVPEPVLGAKALAGGDMIKAISAADRGSVDRLLSAQPR